MKTLIALALMVNGLIIRTKYAGNAKGFAIIDSEYNEILTIEPYNDNSAKWKVIDRRQGSVTFVKSLRALSKLTIREGYTGYHYNPSL